MIRLDATGAEVEEVVEEVARVVFAGGTVIFPTDTVYGLGCDPMRLASVERIFALKNRPRTKALSLHLASVAELLEYARGNALATMVARRFLPGPLTIVVRRPDFIDPHVSGGLPSVGVRVPDHALCRAILERCGPLAATSANISGAASFYGVEGVTELPEADLFVDAGPTPLRAESTVLDLTHHDARLLREGVITTEMLEQQIGHVTRPLFEEAK
ncbi:MAG TPA: L-threonylcarbamoyladenylate synthase [Candidatus Acidoferrales bacterium]|nr:L-threonylcarbamoyladenylate synthase [Candidatus Acidoferrales bacterium]